MWTKAVSGKKKLRIQKNPYPCGRGLDLEMSLKTLREGFSCVGSYYYCILRKRIQEKTIFILKRSLQENVGKVISLYNGDTNRYKEEIEESDYAE